MKSLHRKNLRRQTAQGMLEFALILPLLLVLLMGVIEAGRMLFFYSAALTSSREAVRYGSAAGDIGDANKTPRYEDCSGIMNAAMKLGSFAGVQDANISIKYDNGSPGGYIGYSCFNTTRPIKLGDRIEVQVTAFYQPIVPLIDFPPFPITSTSRRTIVKDVRVEGPPPGSPPTVKFESSGDSADESVRNRSFNLVLDHSSTADVVVNFGLTGSATLGADFTISPNSPYQVLIPAGTTKKTITLTVIDDNIYEADETIVATMGNVINASKGLPQVHTTTILDDENRPQVTFNTPAIGANEDVGNLSLQVLLDHPSFQNITVELQITGGSATSGADYTLSPFFVTIPAYSTAADINIAINDDLLDEDDETLEISMGNITNADPGPVTVHTATIIDNDTAEVHFVYADQSAGEDVGTMIVALEMNVASVRDVVVPFTVGGSADPGTDYTIVPNAPSQVTIPAGSTTSSDIVISVIPDGITESDETVVITMGTPLNALKGTPNVHTATITNANTQLPVAYFTSSGQSGSEAIKTMSVGVTLSAPSNQDVIVPFSVGGTATGSGIDYTISPSVPPQVVIPAGTSSASIVINVIDDGRDENDETVVITMGNPTNAARGAPNVHTATIIDNDPPPTVTFNSSAQTGDEDVGVIKIGVVLSAVSSKDITVPFTVGGTASLGPGLDYTLVPATFSVSMPAGTTYATIDVVVNDDDIVAEGDETAILTLGTPVNATLGNITVHTVTIVENDNPVCPSPDSLPLFGAGNDKNKLSWNLQSPDPLTVVNLMEVTIRWPTGTTANISSITFGSQIYTGDALPPYLSVNTPNPLWSGAFNTRQIIVKFDRNPKSVSGSFYELTAKFENCPPISGVIPSD